MDLTQKDILVDMIKHCLNTDKCEECNYYSDYYNRCGCGKLPEILEILKSLLEI